MPWTDAMMPCEAKYAAQVMYETWGHLEPKPGVKYIGQMTFCQSQHGDLICIRDYWNNPITHKELPSSPGFFSDRQNYIDEHATEPGQIYVFQGYYIRYKNGNHKFVGRLHRAYVTID